MCCMGERGALMESDLFMVKSNVCEVGVKLPALHRLVVMLRVRML